MRPQPGQLDRSLFDVTAGVHQRHLRRERSLADTRTGEYEQQIHLPLTGEAEAYAAIRATVGWEWPFLYAPAQRLVPFQTPHFTYGVEFVTASAPVRLHVDVVGWTISEQGWYMGATVQVGCDAPGATAPVPFSAVAHLSFQGYATYAEGEEFTQ